MTNTLHSINEYDYTGQSNFVAPSHQQASDIVVLVNDVVKTQGTDYTLTGSLVAFTGFTPSTGDKISIRRETASAARQVDFASGSMLKAETLDQDSNQIFNIAQEALDKAEMIGGDYNARYYGASTAAPTLPTPEAGDLWFDATNDVMKVYELASTTWQPLQLNPTDLAKVSTVANISGAVETAAANATGINHYGRTFLGSGTVAPSTYSDGTAIQIGAFWFDSSVNTLKVYQANGWQNAALGITNPINRKSFTAATGQTTFPMSYESGHVDVYLNGVKLVASTLDSAPAADSNGNVTVTLKLAGKPNSTSVYVHSNLWSWNDTYPTPAGTQTTWSEGEATQDANGDWVWTYQVPAGTNFQYEWYSENATEAGFEDLEELEDTGCNDDFFSYNYGARVYRMDITDTWESCNLVGSGLVTPAANDYTASNGTSVVLTSAAAAGDLIDMVADNISPVTQVVTGAAGTDASYNLLTGVMTIPRGTDGTDATVNATNVANAGALMDSEVINLAQVKAFDSSDYLTAHQDISGKANLSGAAFTGDVTTTGTLATGGYTLASTDGTNGQALVTDGSGNVSFGDVTVDVSGKADLSGATFTGLIQADGGLLIPETARLEIGDNSFGGNNTYLSTNASGVATLEAYNNLTIRSTNNVTLAGNGNVPLVKGAQSGGQYEVSLYYGPSQERLKTKVNGVAVTGDITLTGTVDGRDVAADGTKLDGIERTVRQRFQRRGYSSTTSFYALTTTSSQIGDTMRINSGATTAVEHTLDLNITANFLDVNSSNESEFVVTVDAPNPTSETTINLGTAVVAIMGSFQVVGDFTKHFSPYCGMSKSSDGSNAFGFVNYESWSYNPTTNRTTVKYNPYQANTPTQGSSVYLHPFDWETTGTELSGEIYPMESYNESGTTTQNHFHQIYLGYYKPERTFKIKAKEISTSESVQITKVAGTYSQIIGG
jgi:hypothetical protein